MCKFFSFAWDGGSNFLYSDWDLRKEVLNRENPDSHTFILTHFKVAPEKQENWSMYEYNPLTRKFTVDTLVDGHDVSVAEAWVRNLDFKTVVPSLIIKDISAPLSGRPKKVTEKDKVLLKQWMHVPDDFCYSVCDMVCSTTGLSVWLAVADALFAAVGKFILLPVRDDVRKAACIYASSFFNLHYASDSSPLIGLWERGFIPFFDGTTGGSVFRGKC